MQLRNSDFNYDEAFQINLGLFSQAEQQKLKESRICIVGVGGAGGVIAITLARSGIENFTLIDFDTYSPSNMNRQIGCFVDTIGKYKVDVIKSEILRINPLANIQAVNRILPLEELSKMLDSADIYFSEADDLAYSTHSLLLAQKKKVFSICFMPMGMASYIMVFPTDLPKIFDPTDLFGGPAGLDFDDLCSFQNDQTNRRGRRWHVTQGKMRIEWFRKWCRRENTLTQLCPAVWTGAAMASLEAIKYITGKWQPIRVPNMWQIELADNRIAVKRFRLRTWIFSKYIYWVLNLKWLKIGQRMRQLTLSSLEKDLTRMGREEARDENPRLPFMWKHII